MLLNLKCKYSDLNLGGYLVYGFPWNWHICFLYGSWGRFSSLVRIRRFYHKRISERQVYNIEVEMAMAYSMQNKGFPPQFNPGTTQANQQGMYVS